MLKINIVRAKAIAPMLLIILIFPLFFIAGPTLESDRLVRAIWNLGHLIFFGLLVILVNKKHPLITIRSWIILTLIVFVIGGLIELIQEKVGRNGNWEDVYLDLAGAWIALVWLQATSRLLWFARIAVLGLAVPKLASILLLAVLNIRSAQEFPRLADFESTLDLYEFSRKYERSETFRTHGRYGLTLNLLPGRYSGITIKRSLGDWLPYKQMKVDIYNPDDIPLDIVIRVNDIDHDLKGFNDDDRFNGRYTLIQGWNHISIPISNIENGPKDRLMDLSRVSMIIIYTSNLTKFRTIYMDHLRLE
jgi:VanZ family protein